MPGHKLSFWLMPHSHSSQDVSRAFLPIPSVVVWVEWKEQHLWRWFHCVWSAHLCVVRNLFFRFWTLFSITSFDSFNYVPEESVCSKFGLDFRLGNQISLSEIDVIDCEANSIFVGFAFVKMHSAQSICLGYLLSWRVFQLIVKTIYCPSFNFSWCCLRQHFFWCKETFECFEGPSVG